MSEKKKYLDDRTGEICPICKKGKLQQTGKREMAEPAKIPYTGEVHREFTEYECDVCNEKIGSKKATLVKSITSNAKIVEPSK